MTLLNSMPPQAKGLLSVLVGLVGCIFVGIPFLLNLLITFLSFMLLEYGLTILRLPTVSQVLQRWFVNVYRS